MSRLWETLTGIRADSVPRAPESVEADVDRAAGSPSGGLESGDARGRWRREPVRVLFDVNHPAHVHLFKHAIRALEERGHEAFVASREKDVTLDLLEAYDIDHVPLSTSGGSLPSLVGELAAREVRMLSVARRFRPDVIVGRLGPVPVHVSRLVGCRNVVVQDTWIDSRAIRLIYHRLSLPWVDRICTPTGLYESVGEERRRTLDVQELAYLHPDYFQPDPDALREHGVVVDEPYYVVRLVGWDAFHDVGHSGLSRETLRAVVSHLDDHGTVYVSCEGPVPEEFEEYGLPTPPHLVHDLLYYADCYVGDSGTMATEACLLGTPAVRASSMVDDDEPVFRNLERRYGLLQSFADGERALAAVEELVPDGIEEVDWAARRDRVVADHEDVTAAIVEEILDGGEGV